VNLFPQIVGEQIDDVVLYENERCFSIIFNNNYSLLFKMHGNRANLIVFTDDLAVDLFKHNFPNDLEIKLSSLDRPIEQTEAAFIEHKGDYTKLYPTFGKLIKKYFEESDYRKKNVREQWEVLEILSADINKPKKFYTIKWLGDIYFSLIELGEIIAENQSAIEALTSFYYYYSKEQYVYKEKQLLLRQLEKKKSQFINYLKKSSQKLDDIINKPGYNQLADIIMANMHQIPAHSKSVELFNFYTDSMITILLKEQLSPQKNAENLYRKSKNQQIEINQLKKAIEHKDKELLHISKEIEEIKAAEDVKSIKKLSKKNKPASYNQVEVRVPYKRFETNGFVILVGKGARENDELTLKYAKKEDLWLHAKDVTGSHVVLKHQSNKNFPMEVIEKAAQLAAYYSKRKTDSLVPVITTQKKYVRKPKGLPPGKVHIDKEETILVSPDAWWT
jgi:predicted ribosome quality control (RQC) complex YloA/Tae2 family protein